MDIDYIRQGYEYATSQQRYWWTRYLDCYQYAMPNRNVIYQQQQGMKKDFFVYDSTPVNATKSFVAKVQNSITPIGLNWCTLKGGEITKKASKKQVKDLNADLQQVSNIMFDYIRKSNFDTSVPESYFDLAAGTAALYVSETGNKDKPFLFEAIPLYLFSAYENKEGRLTNVYRDYRFLRCYQAKQKFPQVKFPAHVIQVFEESPFEMFPMTDAWIDKEDGTFSHVIGNMGLSEIYFQEDKIKSSPWTVYRWSKLAGEDYGRGPLLDVIGDIKSLNKLGENFLKQCDLVISPPLIANTDSVFNAYNIRIEPGATIPVRGTALGPGQKPIEALITAGNFEIGEWKFNDLRQGINNALFVNPIGSMNDPTKTATEISYRAQLFAQEVGPPMGRLQREFLSPLISRILYILKKQGLLPEKIDTESMYTSISYESPIVQNQRSQDLQSIGVFTQAIAQMLSPEMIPNVVDVPALVHKVGELSGIDLTVLKKPEEIQAIVQKMQNIAQQGAANAAAPQTPQGSTVLPGQNTPGSQMNISQGD